MDGRDQQPQAAPRVASPPQGSGVMMPPHAAYGGAPPGMAPGAANVMHGLPLGFNPMASSGASSPMKPVDMPPGAMYRPDAGAPDPCMQHPGNGGGGAVVGGSGSGELVKKKRGRPRKYGPDGSVGLGPKPAASAEAGGQSGGGRSNSNPDGKRRGRPPGSGRKKQLDALGSSGTSFTPHIITVKPNEDVASKIMAFSQQGPRTTCIISANGALCTATLRQQATSGGVVTYEGHFDILSLSGSFLLAEDGGDTRSRTGGLSVALAGNDGRVVGGCVAGMLMAATPVQVVVGSFIAEGKKPKEEQPKHERISLPPHTAGIGAATGASPPSEGTSTEHSGDLGSPLGPNGSSFTNTGHPMDSTYAPVAWSLPENQGRYDPELKTMTD